MRVLHVINRLSHAGAETSLREFIASSAHEVEHGVAVLHPDHNEFDVSIPSEARFVPTRSLTSIRDGVSHVRVAIRDFEPELVHTSLFEANTAGRVAAKLERIPALTSLVNTPYAAEAARSSTVAPWKRRVVRSVDTFLSRHLTTHHHAITQAVADAAVRDLGLHPDQITVVPRGRERARLGEPGAQRRTRVRRNLGIVDTAPVLLSVGRQEAQKGQRYLLEALPALLDQHADLCLLVAGRKGQMTPVLERLSVELGVEDAVRFLGARDDVPDLLSAADVFVFPSLFEGLGGAVLEAMAMNIPIIASDVPAVREVLNGGSAGVLIAPADHEAITSTCLSLLNSPERAAAMAVTARKRFEANYSARRSAEGLVALYRKVVAL